MKQVISYKYFDIILAFFVAVLLISNIGATKLIEIGPFITDGGAILFPIAYIFGDIFTEVYGYRKARRAILVGFAAMVLAALTFMAVQYLPPAADYTNQAAFEAVLGFVPRIVLASLAGFLVGQFVNSVVLAKLKVKTKGKYLGVRLIGSTVFGELADTVVFCTIAFYGVITGGTFLNYVLVGIAYKISVEIIFLPITYRVIAVLKKREGIDVYDKKTNFNPLSNT
ncbi:MAG: queuosine precursor transporter [Candidatus Saccharimonadales bacterium]